MGWFDTLLELGLELGKKLVDFVIEHKDKIIKIATALAKLVEIVIDNLKDWWNKGGKAIGETDKYDAETASMEETAELGKVIGVLKNQALEIVNKMKEDILKKGKTGIDSLIANLEKGNRNIDSFKNKCYNTLNEFKNESETITKRLSLSDSEFLEIAAQNAGKEKAKLATQFLKKTADESLTKASNSFVEKMTDITNDMNGQLNAELKTMEIHRTNAIETLEKIKKATNAEQKQEQQAIIALSLCKKMALLGRLERI